jgi:CRP/FNR family transcriptional regulator, cyclic AMP receptor protein
MAMRLAAPIEVAAPKLRSIPMFSELNDSEFEAFAELVQYCRYPKRAAIVSRNARGECLYLLTAGRVKVVIASPDGRELALNYLDAPSHFGEMGLSGARAHPADVVAVTDVECFALQADALSRAIQIQPRLALSLIGSLSARLTQTIGRLEDLAFNDATHRVMRVLLNVATASYESRGVPVVQGLTHYDIATLAGTSRETASRIISSLSRDNLVATRGRRIIVDLFRLQERLELD